jgi:GDYXXLXY protein
MKRAIPLMVLLLTCAVGLGLNLATVITREAALSRDAVWKFRIVGFDPLDPFRGRFIEFRAPDLLRINKDAEVEVEYDSEGESAGGEFYAMLERDAEGFGRIAFATGYKPESDGDWLKMRYVDSGEIEPIFTRYYVNESRADELDRRFAAARGEAYITVRISGGVGVITGVGFDE